MLFNTLLSVYVPMTLFELIKEHEKYTDDECALCIKSDEDALDKDTPIKIIDSFDPNDDPIIPNGYDELIMMWHLKEILSGFSILEGELNQEEKLNRLITYFENDA